MRHKGNNYSLENISQVRSGAELSDRHRGFCFLKINMECKCTHLWSKMMKLVAATTLLKKVQLSARISKASADMEPVSHSERVIN